MFNNNMLIPRKLKKGDTIQVVAPARSLTIVGNYNINIAIKKLQNIGLNTVFSKHCYDIDDDFKSSAIGSRIEDLHHAFLDSNIAGIFTAIGGYNSNQLLKYLDYELIKNNFKILCGYSDITALSNAIYAKIGGIGYSGLHFSTWAMEKEFDYNLTYFEKCLFNDNAYEISSSQTWTDDAWYLDQNNRDIMPNDGYQPINQGIAEGTIIGGHLRALNALQGTEFMPSLKNTILFLEDDEEIQYGLFDRGIQSLIHLPDFAGVKGIIIGKFQKISNITQQNLIQIIKSKSELNNIPVIGNVNFGHTNPMITFPIGGTVIMNSNINSTIKVIIH